MKNLHFILGFTTLFTWSAFTGITNAEDVKVILGDSAGESSFTVQDSGKNEKLVVTSDGKVGIGTASPGKRLVVGGTVHSEEGLAIGTNLTDSNRWSGIGLNTTDNVLRIGTYWAGGTKTQLGYTNEGDMLSDTGWVSTLTVAGSNVGIGTTNPDQKLHILDGGGDGSDVAVHLQGGSSNANWIIGTNNSTSGGAADNLWFHKYAGTSGTKMVLTDTGNVGIGTTNPTEKLEVSGNIKASGTITEGSSRVLKKDIAFISTGEAMEALNNLNPVKFKYKTDTNAEEHLGFIAEEVPELVSIKDRKTLRTMDVTAVLTKVVQEQQRMLQEQKETISALKAEMEEIKGKI